MPPTLKDHLAIRAKVNAATGALGSGSVVNSGNEANSFTDPHRRRKVIRKCHPSAIDWPSLVAFRNSSKASLLSQAANITSVRNCIRCGDKMGEPSFIGVRHSDCMRPGKDLQVGGRMSVDRVNGTAAFAKLSVKTFTPLKCYFVWLLLG